MSNKDGRERFFEESFLLADVKPDIVLWMPFLTISNTDIDFQARDLQWNSYIIGNVLPTSRQVELMGKKEFTVVVFDPEYEAFVVYVVTFSVDSGNEIYPLRKAQIAHLKADKAFIKVASEYADFLDIFLQKLAIELSEHMEIYDHVIKLVDD